MRAFATHRTRSLLLVVLLAAPLALTGTRANAQVSPLWDHYKVYFVPPFPVPPLGTPVGLTDQFGFYNHNVLQLELFMNPTQKEDTNGIFPINDPVTHYSWWRITPQPFNALVAATNQFGDQSLNVHDGVYLLNPALKNQGGSLPQKNHYKCYNCDGQPVNKQVLMTDQFGQWSAMVTFPRYFCNPVQKQVNPPVGPTYPILDPNQHYICYEFQPPDQTPRTAVMSDQFTTNHGLNLTPSQYICVPTYKTGFTASSKNTWGKLKMLYR
jgi:hypothetical protein